MTTCDDEYSIITGLELGVDDYISKPFRPRELLARIHTVLRRTNEKKEVLACKDIATYLN